MKNTNTGNGNNSGGNTAQKVDINNKIRDAVAHELNATLAHALDLAAAAKQAHWNVRAVSFQGLHELFDKIASSARDASDELAERARALDALPKGTIQDAAANTTFEPFPNDTTDWRELTTALRVRVLGCANRMRASLSVLSDEPITEDLYIGLIAELEKYGWMLGAHLEG
ncbi:MAG: DNA starvation/stationary phase protection protein [Planctomycetes bacterium]|nr:DNA starvation/stationary phase protection protein [Planctomycetota bacterium]